MRIALSIFLILVTLTAFGKKEKEKKAQQFTIERVIQASADQVWAVVGEDFGAIANSHPQIVRSDYINGSLAGGEGAERVCYFNEKGTKYLKEQQLSYNPDSYTFVVKVSQVAGLPMDPAYSKAVYRVVPIDDNSCKFVFEMTYRTKPAFMGAMARGKFKKTIADYAIAIEHHTITGEAVNKENFKDIKKKYKS